MIMAAEESGVKVEKEVVREERERERSQPARTVTNRLTADAPRGAGKGTLFLGTVFSVQRESCQKGRGCVWIVFDYILLYIIIY